VFCDLRAANKFVSMCVYYSKLTVPSEIAVQHYCCEAVLVKIPLLPPLTQYRFHPSNFARSLKCPDPICPVIRPHAPEQTIWKYYPMSQCNSMKGECS
jgi:hypothetical protein